MEDPDQLVALTTSYRDNPYNPSSYADYQDLRDQNEVFSGLAAYFVFPMGVKGKDRPEVVMGQLVTWNFFEVLGVRPVVGRSFLPEEEQTPNGPTVAIISHRIWQTRFGADLAPSKGFRARGFGRHGRADGAGCDGPVLRRRYSGEYAHGRDACEYLTSPKI